MNKYFDNITEIVISLNRILSGLYDDLIKRGRKIYYSCPRNTLTFFSRITKITNIPLIIWQLYREHPG
jgi:hypothetical protein